MCQLEVLRGLNHLLMFDSNVAFKIAVEYIKQCAIYILFPHGRLFQGGHLCVQFCDEYNTVKFFSRLFLECSTK